MFPARAGMSPFGWRYRPLPLRVPRASGDEPDTIPRKDDKPECSPRERGGARPPFLSRFLRLVFPARAGMSPAATGDAVVTSSVPRASGDEPLCSGRPAPGSPCSPRERG